MRRLALHALVFGNLRAVAVLWARFVRELRFAHWETRTPLPRMPGAIAELVPSITFQARTRICHAAAGTYRMLATDCSTPMMFYPLSIRNILCRCRRRGVQSFGSGAARFWRMPAPAEAADGGAVHRPPSRGPLWSRRHTGWVA